MFNKNRITFAAKAGATLVGLCLFASSPLVNAGAREEAKRMFDRIAGVPPTQAELDTMVAIMDTNADGETDDADAAVSAAAEALNSPSFYNVTLKNMVTPWTNEAQTVFADLNDFTATVIGLVRDGEDFRSVLYDDVVYVGTNNGFAPYSVSDNDHYEDLEASGENMGDPAVLERRTQSEFGVVDSQGAAGVMTTRAAAKSFFVAGTNRAMFRFTLMNFLCNDLEQVKDTTRAPHRIRQDVSRSPGGDSRIFLNSCLGCHAGMDPLAQAFAYYEWTGEEGTEDGQLIYTNGTVQGKHLINADTFRYGFVTTDDSWDNFWREGQNSVLGWDNSISYGVSGCSPGSCRGAKTLGMELAHSEAFAQCQVKQVFETVCLHEPTTAADHTQVSSMVTSFKDSNYNMQTPFVEAAAYCRGN